jgi:tetratricopeptide (TPR) repeat protein
LKKERRKIQKIKTGILFFSLLTLFSCDFSPRIYQEILDAQESIALQKYEKAIAQYERILKKSPPLKIKVKIFYQIGDLYSIYLSKNNKGIEYYKKILEASEEPLWLVKTEERLGEIYFSYTKQYKKSAKSYKALANFTPRLNNQQFYHYRYGLSLFYLNRFEQAEEKFQEMKKNTRNEYHIRSFYYLGLIDFHRQKWKAAIEHWKNYLKVEKRRDNIVQTKFLMANAYETMEELKFAYNIYYSILGEFPNTEVVRNRLKAIYDRRISRKR